jgi:hypothetical protein
MLADDQRTVNTAAWQVCCRWQHLDALCDRPFALGQQLSGEVMPKRTRKAEV